MAYTSTTSRSRKVTDATRTWRWWNSGYHSKDTKSDWEFVYTPRSLHMHCIMHVFFPTSYPHPIPTPQHPNPFQLPKPDHLCETIVGLRDEITLGWASVPLWPHICLLQSTGVGDLSRQPLWLSLNIHLWENQQEGGKGGGGWPAGENIQGSLRSQGAPATIPSPHT